MCLINTLSSRKLSHTKLYEYRFLSYFLTLERRFGIERDKQTEFASAVLALRQRLEATAR